TDDVTLAACADTAQTLDVGLVKRPSRVPDPQLCVGQPKDDPIVEGRMAAHRVISVLKQLVDEATPVVVRDLCLLRDVFLETDRTRAVDTQVLRADHLQQVSRFRNAHLSLVSCTSRTSYKKRCVSDLGPTTLRSAGACRPAEDRGLQVTRR